jgi:hypothetical protein
MEASVSERALPQLQHEQPARVKGENGDSVGISCFSGLAGLVG